MSRFSKFHCIGIGVCKRTMGVLSPTTTPTGVVVGAGVGVVVRAGIGVGVGALTY